MENLKPSTLEDPAADRLSGIRHELLSDLNDATQMREHKAAEALAAHSSTFQLLVEVKKLARALVEVCRSHAPRCAQIHAKGDEPDPARAAMRTLGLVLCKYLWLPPNTSLLMNELMSEPWPESNRVRQFVLEIANAPVDPSDFLLRQMRLPRWEPKMRYGRRIAGLEPNPPQGEDATWLSADESETHLRGLEESFRNHLSERLLTVYATASSAMACLGNPFQRTQKRQGSRSTLGSSQTDLVAVLLDSNDKDKTSRNRAQLVAKAMSELQALVAEPEFELPEDFDVARTKFPRFYVLSSETPPGLKERILRVKNVRLVGLAQHIVSIREGVKIDTVRKDWKKHKPNTYRKKQRQG